MLQPRDTGAIDEKEQAFAKGNERVGPKVFGIDRQSREGLARIEAEVPEKVRSGGDRPQSLHGRRFLLRLHVHPGEK